MALFAGLFQLVAVDYGDHPTFLSPLYYSVVTLTTLGYGDAVPASASAQVLAMIGTGLESLLELGDVGGTASLLVSSAIASSVTDNIPLAAMLTKILSGIPGVGDDPTSPLWWAVIFGANLGGNITPVECFHLFGSK